MSKYLDRHTRLVRMQIDILSALERAEQNVNALDDVKKLLKYYALELKNTVSDQKFGFKAPPPIETRSPPFTP